MKKTKIQQYINNYRRYLSPHLKPNIGVHSIVYPYDKGVVLEFEFKENASNNDEYRAQSKNISEALKRADVREFGENKNKLTFHGTNTIMTSNKIFYIKDNEPQEWFENKAQEDVNNILHSKS